MSGQKLANLQNLPTELQANIAEHLDYGSLLALHQVNRHFRKIADPVKCSDWKKYSFVHAAEQYPRHVHNFGCYRCFCVLPASQFADRQKKKDRGKGNAKSSFRFCLKCGVEKGICSPGNYIVKNGVEMICCWECRRVREVQFCPSCRYCSSCLPLLPRIGNESAARDVKDLTMSLFGLSNRTAPEKIACPRCRQGTIQGKAPEPKRWYDDIDRVTALGMALSMAEFEAEFDEIASPEWFDGDDFVYQD